MTLIAWHQQNSSQHEFLADRSYVNLSYCHLSMVLDLYDSSCGFCFFLLSLSSLQVQTLLTQMQDKFQQMSDQIITRIDDMSTRIDDLERNIGELMNQAGVDEPEK